MQATHSVPHICPEGFNTLSSMESSFIPKLDVTDEGQLLGEEARLSLKYPADGCIFITFPWDIEPRVL
jgi:hypothetical protein